MAVNGPLVDKLARLVDFSHDDDTETGKQSFIRHVMNMHDEGNRLPREFFAILLDDAHDRNAELSNVLSISRDIGDDDQVYKSAVTVIGDLHGQYRDFAAILTTPRLGGMPNDHNKLLFNGDIVDRGDRAVEILSVVLLAQVLFPRSVYFVRGNHECEYLTKMMGFEEEVKRKYDEDLYKQFLKLFAVLPLAAVIQNEVFVTHGGISIFSSKMTIAQLNALDRFKTSDDDDLLPALNELLWADPTDLFQHLGRSKRGGAVWSFGKGATERFLALNGLKLLMRSHQTAHEGYQLHHDGQCVTVYSASDYMKSGNLGAVAKFDAPESMEARYETFWEADHEWPMAVMFRECQTALAAQAANEGTPDGNAEDSSSGPVAASIALDPANLADSAARAEGNNCLFVRVRLQEVIGKAFALDTDTGVNKQPGPTADGGVSAKRSRTEE